MSGQNPYAPPSADVNLGAAVDEAAQLMTAGMGARFLNFLIDNVLVVLVGSIVVGVVTVVRGQDAPSDAAANVAAFGTMIAYYVAFEGFFGWTIGKLITGTRVKRFDGRKPGFLQVVGRTAARFIPFEPFSLLFGASNMGWHDSMSGTRVVRVRR